MSAKHTPFLLLDSFLSMRLSLERSMGKNALNITQSNVNVFALLCQSILNNHCYRMHHSLHQKQTFSIATKTAICLTGNHRILLLVLFPSIENANTIQHFCHHHCLILSKFTLHYITSHHIPTNSPTTRDFIFLHLIITCLCRQLWTLLSTLHEN